MCVWGGGGAKAGGGGGGGGVLKMQGYNSSIRAIHRWPLQASYTFLVLFCFV